jgi:methylmalonyl-CoA mutase
MAESQPKPLAIASDFPPVPTAAWEEQIRRDLDGADYEKRLVWRTDEGIAVRPYYRAADVTVRDPLVRGGRTWSIVEPGHEPAADVSAVGHHEAGATAVQEVAWAIAEGADRLASGAAVASFDFAIGSNHFMEIAKLRAVRLLWAQVAGAFDRAASGATIRIHARTAGENKTLYDPSVNLLRATTEAISAILGGCDSLTITPCGFDPHLAENVHHILREESHLDQVADPGAGSYCIEALTDAVARRAWALFQEIEGAGGFAAYRSSGAFDAALRAARTAKEQAVASRRRVLVGTNNYPDLDERRLDAAGEAPGGWRLAAPFEAIRLRTERHARNTGRTPRVLLLTRGDLPVRTARAAFCLNFFGCAGFDVVSSDQLADADLVVLCSSDAEYPALAREMCPQARGPVLVAGNPRGQADELTAAGVADFVHALSNAAETLAAWQDRLGMD